MKTPMTKLMLAAAAATMLCLGARALEQDTDGYYMLGSVQDWRDFAALVDTNPEANAKMTADIDLGDDQTQIGSDNGTIVDFEGIFDGQGHTLTIKYNGTVHRIAPFRGLNGGTIKNLHVTGTINSSQNQPASIAAVTVGSTVISNVWSDVTITSTGTSWVEAGAFVGLVYAGSLTLKDCLFSGAITSPSSFNGCFVGYISGGSATLANCLATGTFSYTGGSIAFCGNHSNCYVKQFPVSYPSGVTQPTDDELSGGTTATALQAGREEEVWVQGDDGPMLAVFAKEKETITWLNDDSTEIDTTEVVHGAMPTHADPTKAADAPYRWVFTGWAPELEAAVSNTTYTATFQKIADLALVTEDWTAKDGDMITGETTHNVSIPGGATVTINGVSVTGMGGGAAVDAPLFSDSGESAVTKFEGAGNTWTLTAFAEMEGDSVGTAVTDGQIKVYAADSVEELKTAEPLASGVEVEEKKSAVKTKINVTLPSTPEKQFFKVEFGE